MDSVRQKVEQFRKNITPAVKCFRPYRIFNERLGVFEYHNCGKCPYCLSLRSNELASRCFNECKQHLYSLFFTLTLDNEHIPYIVKGRNWYYLANRTVKSIDGVSTPIVHVSEMDIPQDKRIETSYGLVDIEAFGVVHLPDIQKFKKRLRINISRKLNNYDPITESADYQRRERELDVRIFINPEYGPTTLRPHYHGILWTDCKEVADMCLDPEKGKPVRGSDPYLWHGLIYKSWKMCAPERIDVQHVVKSAPNYVSQYVASSYSLPSVLLSKPFRPKVLASKNPVIGSYKTDFETIKDIFFNGIVELPTFVDGEAEPMYLPVPYSTYIRYFPKCQAFSFQTSYGKLQLYEKYVKQRYVKRPLVKHGIFDERSLNVRSLDHNLDNVDDVFTDNFRYQNLRFMRMVKFWSSRPFRFPIRDHDNKIIHYETLHLTPLEVIKKFERLYDNLALFQLRNMYLEQEIISENASSLFCSRFHMLEYLLSYYPGFVHSLKGCLSTHKDYQDLMIPLESFGLLPIDLYSKNSLRPALLSFLKSNFIVNNFRMNCVQKVHDKSKSKKFKEHYARQKGIIY